MLFGGSTIIRVVLQALHPGWWAVLYQLPVACAMAWVIARQQARPDTPRADVLHVTAVVGLGGALTFAFFMAVTPALFGAVLSLVIMWVGTSFALDKYLDVDWESSQRLTGLICGPIWLAWLIIGAVIIVLR